ncbi:patatin-like phospholipase family protein [Tranquillimonas rosea]|uniref:patatin-like phospholipase family protein n=1 Tax=Tranquillimonas rosea TaxID=641238 RepID=UPI003BA90A61
MANLPEFNQIVFSGGGTRCFWQGGFLDVIAEEKKLTPARVTGVSGGALSAACWIASKERELFDRMRETFRKQESNIAWHTREVDGMTPHQRLYREVVTSVIDAEAEQRVADGPEFHILLAHPHSDAAGTLTGMLSTLIYEAELHIKARADGQWPEQTGVESSFVDARDVARQGHLCELVCAAATIPPIFELPEWQGRKVIDGGMASQVPFPQPDEGKTLILLTRNYEELPEAPGRVFVAPSREVPADKIDFTDAGKITRTWDLGKTDARSYLQSLR